jgi:glycerol uptake facilitator-like aquaporin
MCLCYLSGLLFITIGSYGITQVGVYVGITNIFLLSLFIYAVSPGSGGHINPFITFTTMLAGLTGFARGILYMTAQTMGAALAGGLIRGSFGEALTQKYDSPIPQNAWIV